MSRGTWRRVPAVQPEGCAYIGAQRMFVVGAAFRLRGNCAVFIVRNGPRGDRAA